MTIDYRREFEKPKKQVEQTISDPTVFIKDFRLEPHTKVLRTNNFIQNTLSRLLAYSPTDRAMVKLRADEEGRLEVFEGMPGSVENRRTLRVLERDVANGTTHTFATADRLFGNIDLPYTVPAGYKLFFKHMIVCGTSPAEWQLQVNVAGTYTNISSVFVDSYDEYDMVVHISDAFAAATQFRLVVINHGGTGDFAAAASGWLEKEVVD